MRVEPNEHTYVVAGARPWNRRVFDEVIKRFPGRWVFLAERGQLTPDCVHGISPRYAFFLHWSWIVPEEIIDNYECVCFHMADVPYGRGGSPLQNLVARGHRETKLSALRMVRELDAGPVYMKEPLSLEGGAEEIYIRATRLCAKMIECIVREEPEPQPQEGEVIVFERRTPDQSEIPKLPDELALFDFIRMVDAEGYPKAFLEHKGFRYEFSRPALYDGRIVADVVITRTEEGR